MSLVTITAQNDYISVMSDGLVCYLHPDGKLERIEERCRKYFQISSKQFVAVTGDKIVLDYLSRTIPFLEEGYNLKELAEGLNSQINSISREIAKSTISVGGVGIAGEIEYFVFSNRGGNFEHVKPTNNTLSSHFLTSLNVTDDMYKELELRFQSMLTRNKSNTIKQICKSQKELFLFVEKIDVTVNNKVSHLLIEK